MSQHHLKGRKSLRQRNSLYRRVLARDKGICNFCKVDTISLFKRLEQIAFHDEEKAFEEAKAFGITRSRLRDALGARHPRLWDFDHVMPISDGGLTLVGNLRTLCVECHLKLTQVSYYLNKQLDIPERLIPFFEEYIAET